ncbi:hypothetical protein [Neoroseomonas lacus]|uniref:Uncharacterized protein n=1 Tax=Neoroseomonas lacus TaxID=287609 RepID=A0A917L526_9PROT|nr:hypothetical protein [Neoroseomonas lacus]GGJ45127.1 hypothetical protein GCM10011320_60690 [Neoroseomonas lacus]
MDAATAAAMSDPHCNPHFRRRWNEAIMDAPPMPALPGRDPVGTFGLVLQEALSRATRSGGAVHLRQKPEGPSDG